MSFGGGKLKPEDLFSSLKILKEEQISENNSTTVGQKFFNRFKSRFTEEVIFDG